MLRSLLIVGTCFSAFAVHAAQPMTPPIVPVKAKPNDSVLKDSAWNKPIVVKSADDAAKHFSKDDLATLTKEVDFKKQFVLVFAWKGSGGDKLDARVAESFPEQIFFSLTPGLTRDLRTHIKVFALRSNVRWSVAGKAGKEKASIRPIKVIGPEQKAIVFTADGQDLTGKNKLITLADAAAVEKLVGKQSAKVLIDAVDFRTEKIVLLSWATSDPPGILQYEATAKESGTQIHFHVRGPDSDIRFPIYHGKADFYVIPRDADVSFDPKEKR